MIFILIFFTIAISYVKGEDVNLQYTTVSYSVKGEPCINDCVNNKCFVDMKLRKETCNYSDEPAPTYYTTMSSYNTLSIPKCLSKCGSYDYNDKTAYQCFVSNDRTYWDYCNSDLNTQWISSLSIKTRKDLSYETYVDSCNIGGYSDLCTNEQGNIDEIHTSKPYRFKLSKGSLEANCIDICKATLHVNGVDTSYTCPMYWKDEVLTNRLCAPPARPPSLEKYFESIPNSDCKYDLIEQEGNILLNNNTENRKNLSETANKIQNSPYFTTVTFNDDRNPILNCTVKPSADYGEPVLPLVIRAKITKGTIRPFYQNNLEEPTPIVSKNLDRMEGLPYDEPSRLIGYQIGGSNAICNVVPLFSTVAFTLKTYENEIYNWISEEQINPSCNDVDVRSQQQGDNTLERTADMTVVVMYENSTRPSALGVDIVYYEGDLESKERTSGILCNRDPKQERILENWLQKRCNKRSL